MGTIRFMFGCSGVGKSTRLYELFKYLRSCEKPEVLLIEDVPMGYLFKDKGVAIIGKENKKPTGITFQGLDAFIGKLGNFEKQYNSIYRFAEAFEGDTIVESVLAMSTNRTGPEYIEANGFNVEYVSEFFIYPSWEAFKERVAARGGKVYENEADAPIWLKNEAYIRKNEVFQEEIKVASRKFSLSEYPYDDPQEDFAKRFLDSSGRSGEIYAFNKFRVEERERLEAKPKPKTLF